MNIHEITKSEALECKRIGIPVLGLNKEEILNLNKEENSEYYSNKTSYWLSTWSTGDFHWAGYFIRTSSYVLLKSKIGKYL